MRFDKTSTVAAGGGVTQITVDSTGTPAVVTPTAGNLNLNVGQSNTNNDDGINIVGSSPTITINLTNRNSGTVTTTDATPTTLLSVALGSGAGTYIAEGNVIAFNTTDTASGAYTFRGAARSDTVTATELAIEGVDAWEEASMEDGDIEVAVSGNNLVVTVTGIAGRTINWNGFFNYRYVG